MGGSGRAVGCGDDEISALEIFGHWRVLQSTATMYQRLGASPVILREPFVTPSAPGVISAFAYCFMAVQLLFEIESSHHLLYASSSSLNMKTVTPRSAKAGVTFKSNLPHGLHGQN